MTMKGKEGQGARAAKGTLRWLAQTYFGASVTGDSIRAPKWFTSAPIPAPNNSRPRTLEVK